MSQVYESAADTVAQLVGETVFMDFIAEGIAGAARANASRHTDDDLVAQDRVHFADQIKVISAAGGKDRLIINTDPLAVPKELGHILVRHGEQVGYVRGQYSMRNAALNFRG